MDFQIFVKYYFIDRFENMTFVYKSKIFLMKLKSYNPLITEKNLRVLS